MCPASMLVAAWLVSWPLNWLPIDLLVQSPSVPDPTDPSQLTLARTAFPSGDPAPASRSCWGDFDADGWIDLFVGNPGGEDHLLRNSGNGSFQDVTALHGLEGLGGSRLALWLDFDGDGALDLYVSSARGESRLFQNTDRGRFVDVTSHAGLGHPGAALLVEVVDYDGDRRPDLHMLTEQGDVLFHNLGRGSFERALLPVLEREVPFVGAPRSWIGPSDEALGPPAEGASTAESVDEASGSGNPRNRTEPPSPGSSRGAPASSSRSAGPAGGPPTTPPPGSGTEPPAAVCLPGILDQATMDCIEASSAPGILGRLYPLSDNLFVGATGNVGIGLTDPDSKLDVRGQMLVSGISGAGYRALHVSGSVGGVTKLGATSGGGESRGDLAIQTNDTDRIYIRASDGNVGIGTTVPNQKLDVGGEIRSVTTAISYSAGPSTTDGRFSIRLADAGPDPAGATYYDAVIGGSNSGSGYDAMTIKNANGYIGIGTATPTSKVTIRDSSSFLELQSPNPSGDIPLVFANTADNQNWQLRSFGGTRISIFHGNTTGGPIGDVLTALPNGNVGIGTTDPTARLAVAGALTCAGDLNVNKGDSSDAMFRVVEAATTAYFGGNGSGQANISFSAPGQAAPPYTFFNDSNTGLFWAGADAIGVSTGGSERFRIDSGGNVGIGTPSPWTKLQVKDGTISVINAAGNLKTQTSVDTFADTGFQRTYGANGSPNTLLGYLGGFPNHGAVEVEDAFGAGQAAMYVDSVGNGIVYGDVKAFRTPNPADMHTDIWYACVEGPEAAMYVRGTGRLIGGRAVIELPNHFRALASVEDMTVQLTAHGLDTFGLGIVRKSLDSIEIGELKGGRGDFEFDWEVKAVRKGFEGFEVVRRWDEAMPGDLDREQAWQSRLRSIQARRK